MEAWSGLRARVAINLAAAASLTFGLLALSSIIVMQRAMRDTEDAGLSTAATLIAADYSACTDEDCRRAVAFGAHASGLSVSIHEHRTSETNEIQVVPARAGKPAHLSIERQVGYQVVEIEAPLGPMINRARSAITILLVFLFLNAVVLVIMGTFLLDRGLLRRLSPITESMARIERFELEEPLLASEGGDELGRMGGTLHRIRERLREDKQKTTAYIAELETTNRELRETREGLARSERLATVGRLAAGVAHEIGNPVAAILGYLDLLRHAPTASATEYVERIDREAKRVDRIVRDLLDFARPQPLLTGPVSLQQVVESAVRLVQPQPRWRSMKVVVEMGSSLPAVHAQEHYAVQVVLNLLINAADACDGKGEVHIRTRVEGPRIVLEISDNGPGITTKDAAHIFDPFFTTKSPGEGAGLGLSISHSIMESFGGSIRAAAAQPHGAIFTLEFRAVTPVV